MNKNRVKNILLDHMIEILLVLVVVIMAIVSPNFLTPANILNIFRNQAMKGVIAFGMTMVIISGQIDLSVGSQVALSGAIIARFCRDLPASTGMSVGMACILGILTAILGAALIGGIHAFAQHRFNMPAFIITLASLNVLYGLAGVICQGFPIANVFPKEFIFLGTGTVFGVIPVPAVILLIIFAVCFLLMTYTTTGRSIYAVGGNAESARLSGIHVFRSKVIVFAGVQVMCVLAGMMHSAQVASGSFSFGRGWEVDVISAVVIGGTSMNGGVGKPWGTLMGILFLGVITNAMTILNLDIYLQYVIKGLVMALAVFLSMYQAKAKA
ncbi:MAG: ABC transporter permease [Lachnospiraceae bacterium]|jgi:ribose/xylose/arabinose/galactoside ABC-type transport system permease subunit|nr:ABC transporter permease [Lachnospiraceae bacterium]